MAQLDPQQNANLDRKLKKLELEEILFWVLSPVPLLIVCCCCGGCGLWLFAQFNDARKQLGEYETKRAVEESRRNAVRTAAIDTAKRALAERGHSRIAGNLSAQQDSGDGTR